MLRMMDEEIHIFDNALTSELNENLKSFSTDSSLSAVFACMLPLAPLKRLSGRLCTLIIRHAGEEIQKCYKILRQLLREVKNSVPSK